MKMLIVVVGVNAAGPKDLSRLITDIFQTNWERGLRIRKCVSAE